MQWAKTPYWTHTLCWRAQQEGMNPWAFLGWSTVQPANQSTNYQSINKSHICFYAVCRGDSHGIHCVMVLVGHDAINCDKCTWTLWPRAVGTNGPNKPIRLVYERESAIYTGHKSKINSCHRFTLCLCLCVLSLFSHWFDKWPYRFNKTYPSSGISAYSESVVMSLECAEHWPNITK